MRRLCGLLAGGCALGASLALLASCAGILAAQESGTVLAQEPSPPALQDPIEEGGPPPVPDLEMPLPESGAGGPEDAGEVEAFFDGLMAAWMEAGHVAGATVAVVRDGEILMAKGYGFADVEARIPVSAETTLFRIGSISKLFVWTAVMQLVEGGRLDLNRDVNAYLADLQVPETFPEPVTMAHLMTHTAGFEDQVIGLFGRDETGLAPLAAILARELPARIRPPGEVASYSNHGTGLAAHLVESIAALSWDDYVGSRILEPLGMSHATFRQPLPASLVGDMAKGYRWQGGFVEQPFEYVPLAPVGAASASAEAMARFMLAHLQLGQLGQVRVLQPATVRQMRQELFRHAPDTNPMAHGFIDMSRNGQWVIGHGGDTLWFHSELALLPDRGVGLFVATNSEGGGAVAGAVVGAFMNEYYPAEDPEPLAPQGDAARYEWLTGSYRANRYSHSTLAKLAALQTVQITVDPAGRLRMGHEDDVRWIEMSPLTFREEHGERFLVFRQDDAGAVTHAFRSDLPILAFERVDPSTDPALHGPLLGGGLLVMLWTVLAWPLAAFLRRYYDYRLSDQQLIPLAAKGTAWTASLVFLAFAAGLAGVLSDANQIVFGATPMLRALLVLPFVGAGLSLVAAGWLVQVLRTRRGSRAARLGYGILVLAFAVVLWQLSVWNLIGFRY